MVYLFLFFLNILLKKSFPHKWRISWGKVETKRKIETVNRRTLLFFVSLVPLQLPIIPIKISESCLPIFLIFYFFLTYLDSRMDLKVKDVTTLVFFFFKNFNDVY